jgi:hypothetical protein
MEDLEREEQSGGPNIKNNAPVEELQTAGE